MIQKGGVVLKMGLISRQKLITEKTNVHCLWPHYNSIRSISGTEENCYLIIRHLLRKGLHSVRLEGSVFIIKHSLALVGKAPLQARNKVSSPTVLL